MPPCPRLSRAALTKDFVTEHVTKTHGADPNNALIVLAELFRAHRQVTPGSHRRNNQLI